MWNGLIGKWSYAAGTSGTVTLPKGAIVISVYGFSTAGGTIVIFGGASIPVVATKVIAIGFNHMLVVSRGDAAQSQIVFTGTDSYFVEYVVPGYSA